MLETLDVEVDYDTDSLDNIADDYAGDKPPGGKCKNQSYLNYYCCYLCLQSYDYSRCFVVVV